MYTHCGANLDILNHFGFFGCYWNGWTSEKYLSSRHWMIGGAEKYLSIIARGILLDIAGLRRRQHCARGHPDGGRARLPSGALLHVRYRWRPDHRGREHGGD